MNRSCFLSLAACRTPPNPWDTRFPLCVGCMCGLSDVLLGLRPSLPNLRRRLPFFVRLVHRYYGTVRLLLHVHVRRSVYGLRGPALICRPRRAGDLPVLVHVVSQRARVLRLRRTGQPLAINAAAVLPSSSTERSRHPDPSAFRSSIARPTDTSVYASTDTSRCSPQDSRPGWIRFLLSCRALSSPTTCRFIPAHSGLPVIQVQRPETHGADQIGSKRGARTHPSHGSSREICRLLILSG